MQKMFSVYLIYRKNHNTDYNSKIYLHQKLLPFKVPGIKPSYPQHAQKPV